MDCRRSLPVIYAEPSEFDRSSHFEKHEMCKTQLGSTQDRQTQVDYMIYMEILDDV